MDEVDTLRDDPFPMSPPQRRSLRIQEYNRLGGDRLFEQSDSTSDDEEPAYDYAIAEPSVHRNTPDHVTRVIRGHVRSAHHCPPEHTPSLARWIETWPNVPHWRHWRSAMMMLDRTDVPCSELVLGKRQVVRAYQERILRLF